MRQTAPEHPRDAHDIDRIARCDQGQHAHQRLDLTGAEMSRQRPIDRFVGDDILTPLRPALRPVLFNGIVRLVHPCHSCPIQAFSVTR